MMGTSNMAGRMREVCSICSHETLQERSRRAIERDDMWLSSHKANTNPNFGRKDERLTSSSSRARTGCYLTLKENPPRLVDWKGDEFIGHAVIAMRVRCFHPLWGTRLGAVHCWMDTWGVFSWNSQRHACDCATAPLKMHFSHYLCLLNLLHPSKRQCMPEKSYQRGGLPVGQPV